MPKWSKIVPEWWRTRHVRGSEARKASMKLATVASEVRAENTEEAKDLVFHDALKQISESRVSYSVCNIEGCD